MNSIFLLILVNLSVCILCENLFSENDDDLHQVYDDRNMDQYDAIKIEKSSYKWQDYLLDEPSNIPSTSYAGSIDKSHRMKFRHRKISSNNRKKNSFRRGQRHRNNKNGN